MTALPKPHIFTSADSKPLRWGIFGAGWIAEAMVNTAQKNSNQQFVAVASRTPGKAEAFAQKWKIESFHNSYEELAAREDIDAIYIATLPSDRLEVALVAINAGKPVLIEKPITMDLAEAEQIYAAAKAKKVLAAEAMWTRFLPHIAQVRELLNSGVIGQIVNVEADHGQYLIDHENPRLTEPSLAGGALLDLGIYPVSFAHMVLGKPARIIATGVLTEKGVDSQTSAILDYENGAQAVLTTTLITSTPCRATIAGTLGRIEIDRTFYNPASMRLVIQDGTTTEYPNTYKGHGLREQAAELERMVRNAEIESPLLTHKMSIEIMLTLDEIRNQIGLRYPFEN